MFGKRIFYSPSFVGFAHKAAEGITDIPTANIAIIIGTA